MMTNMSVRRSLSRTRNLRILVYSDILVIITLLVIITNMSLTCLFANPYLEHEVGAIECSLHQLVCVVRVLQPPTQTTSRRRRPKRKLPFFFEAFRITRRWHGRERLTDKEPSYNSSRPRPLNAGNRRLRIVPMICEN